MLGLEEIHAKNHFVMIGLKARKKLSLKVKDYGVIPVEFRLGSGNKDNKALRDEAK